MVKNCITPECSVASDTGKKENESRVMAKSTGEENEAETKMVQEN